MSGKGMILMLWASLSGATYAQNLVHNGGFEEFTTDCAFGIGYNVLEDWSALDCGLSPGLAHACNNDVGNGGGVPHSGLGYQQSHGGDAFITIWTLRMNSQGGYPNAIAGTNITGQSLVGWTSSCRSMI